MFGPDKNVVSTFICLPLSFMPQLVLPPNKQCLKMFDKNKKGHHLDNEVCDQDDL